MTVLVDDPLIASMAIAQTLPLHESSRRLRELYPECPRVYGVAVMGDLSRRRWWPLAQALTTRPAAVDVRARGRGDRQPRRGRPAARGDAGARGRRTRRSRCSCSRAAPGTPAWRTCGCTWTPRARSTGSGSSIRRCARCPTTRSSAAARRCASGNPPGRHRRPAQRGGADDVDRTPQPSRARAAVRQARRGQRRRRCRSRRCGTSSARAVVSAATQVPLLAGSSELTSMRRGQAVLDALVGFGLPVRGTTPDRRREGLAKLGQPCLYS